MQEQQQPPAQATLVTMAEFARIKGVTQGAVQDAIKKGRLTPASFQLAPNGAKRLLVLDVANREWACRKRRPVRGVDAEKEIAAKTGAELENHYSARIKKEEYAAKMAQLEYEQKSGKLVKIEDVKVEAFSLARMVRDNILNIPDRISHELAAETDPHQIHILLTRSLNEALDQLARIDQPDQDVSSDEDESREEQ